LNLLADAGRETEKEKEMYTAETRNGQETRNTMCGASRSDDERYEEPAKRALALIRYSSNSLFPSPQEQLEQCLYFAQAQGFTVTRTLVDLTDSERGISFSILTFIENVIPLLDDVDFVLTHSPRIFGPSYEDFEDAQSTVGQFGLEVAYFYGYQPTRGRVIKDAVGLCRGFVVGEVMSPSEVTKLVEAIPELRNV